MCAVHSILGTVGYHPVWGWLSRIPDGDVLPVDMLGFAVLSNSIDAGATGVEVSIDVPCYRLTVVDNGSGIPEDKLQSLVATDRGEGMRRGA